MSRNRKDYDDEYDNQQDYEYIKPKKRKRRKMILRNKIILGVCVFLMICFSGVLTVYLIGNGYISKLNHEGYNYTINDNVKHDEEEVESGNVDEALNALVNADLKDFFESGTPAEASYVKNILLIGVDDRAAGQQTGNSDTMILLSINSKTNQIFMTSFMRDMYVYVPNADKYDKLNYAHAYGGSNLLCETITGNFKVKVDQYVRVDFYSLMDIIDAVGGIDMELSADEVAVANKTYIYYMCQDMGLDPSGYYIQGSGMLHLSGMQAVAYARIRYVGNADYERTNRQRKVLAAIAENCKSMSVSELNKFANAALPKISTNMDNDDIWDLITDAPSLLKDELVSQRMPYDDSSHSMAVFLDGYNVSVLTLNDQAETVRTLISTIYQE